MRHVKCECPNRHCQAKKGNFPKMTAVINILQFGKIKNLAAYYRSRTINGVLAKFLRGSGSTETPVKRDFVWESRFLDRTLMIRWINSTTRTISLAVVKLHCGAVPVEGACGQHAECGRVRERHNKESPGGNDSVCTAERKRGSRKQGNC